jgi:hypothetical protein
LARDFCRSPYERAGSRHLIFDVSSKEICLADELSYVRGCRLTVNLARLGDLFEKT